MKRYRGRPFGTNNFINTYMKYEEGATPYNWHNFRKESL